MPRHKFEKGNKVGFKEGQSGNPGGRRRMPDALKVKCENATEEVIDAWIDEVRLKTRTIRAQGGHLVEVECRGEDWIKASQLIAAYAYGEPTKQVEHTGANGEALSVTVQFVGPQDAEHKG